MPVSAEVTWQYGRLRSAAQVTWQYDRSLARPDRAVLHYGFLPPPAPGLLAAVDTPGYSVHQAEYPSDDRAFGALLRSRTGKGRCVWLTPQVFGPQQATLCEGRSTSCVSLRALCFLPVLK